MSDKLFVAGVSWATTDDAFKNCFKVFGELKECQVMRDPSGRSRGFGFVVFASEDTKSKVLGQQLQLDGRKLDIQLAVSKEDLQASKTDVLDTKKVWVAGLSFNTTDDSLFNYFARFGEIEKASTIRDKQTEKSRGFAFVSFIDQEVADSVLKMTDLELDGRKLDLKLAVPKGGAISAQPKKCYVAGMLEITTQETFEAHFAQFGEITESFIQKDKSGKSRGFGFVTYECPTSATKAITYAEHILDGKNVDCKAAVPRKEAAPAGMAGWGPQRGNMAAMGAMRMAAARQYQMQFQAMQAQMQQQAAQAQVAFAARPVQPNAAYAGQYANAATAQAFAAMNPNMANPGMTANPAMPSMANPGMNPTMAPSTMNASMGNPMGNGSTSQAVSGYERYPSSYPSAGTAGAYGAAQSQYPAYDGQDQSRPEGRGAYSVSNNVYAQQGGRATGTSATDPYAQYGSSYGEDAYGQYAHARRSTNRTVGYHPYSR